MVWLQQYKPIIKLVMKKMIVSAFMLTMCAGAYAQQATTTTTTTATTTAVHAQEDQKTKIETSALPDAVKKSLATDTYKGWQASGAWVVKATPEYYVIELQNGDKKNTVKMDKEGKAI